MTLFLLWLLGSIPSDLLSIAIKVDRLGVDKVVMLSINNSTCISPISYCLIVAIRHKPVHLNISSSNADELIRLFSTIRRLNVMNTTIDLNTLSNASQDIALESVSLKNVVLRGRLNAKKIACNNIVIASCTIDARFTSMLQNLTATDRLVFSQCVFDKIGPGDVAVNNNIYHVKITNCNIDGNSMKVITILYPNTRFLYLNNSKIDVKALWLLQDFGRLENLNLYKCSGLSVATINMFTACGKLIYINAIGSALPDNIVNGLRIAGIIVSK